MNCFTIKALGNVERGIWLDRNRDSWIVAVGELGQGAEQRMLQVHWCPFNRDERHPVAMALNIESYDSPVHVSPHKVLKWDSDPDPADGALVLQNTHFGDRGTTERTGDRATTGRAWGPWPTSLLKGVVTDGLIPAGKAVVELLHVLPDQVFRVKRTGDIGARPHTHYYCFTKDGEFDYVSEAEREAGFVGW